MTTNIFTYGSLMFPEIWAFLIQTPYSTIEATLPGYKRKPVTNEAYPGLLSGDKNNLVTGKLYLQVGDADLNVLDKFEGDFYIRSQVTVTDNLNQRLSAETYLVKNDYLHLLDEIDWCPKNFEKEFLTSFIKKPKHF